MRHRLVISLAAIAIVPPASAAAAPVVDGVQVGIPKTPTRGFSAQLGVFLESPGDYERGCCYDSRQGEWVGPSWQSSSGASDRSHIEWQVTNSRTGKSIAALARGGGRSG